MAIQHFSPSSIFTRQENHMHSTRSSPYLKTIHRPAVPLTGLFEWQSKEIMFCVPFGGFERGKTNQTSICGNRDPLSLVCSPLDRKQNVWELWLMKLEPGCSKSLSTWRRHGYNNHHSRKRWQMFCSETLAAAGQLNCGALTRVYTSLLDVALTFTQCARWTTSLINSGQKHVTFITSQIFITKMH